MYSLMAAHNIPGNEDKIAVADEIVVATQKIVKRFGKTRPFLSSKTYIKCFTSGRCQFKYVNTYILA